VFSIKPKEKTNLFLVKIVKEIYGILSIQIFNNFGEIWLDEQDRFL